MKIAQSPGGTPVRFAPSLEKIDADETAIGEQLRTTLHNIQQQVFVDSGHAERAVHAKGHGILVGEMRVLDQPPGALAQGLFAAPAKYPIVMRLSTIPGDVLDDNVSVPRGLALKVIGVAGARVTGSESDTTQDFLFSNGPAFAKSHPRDFLKTLKVLAATTDKAPGLKKALSAVARGAEHLLEAVGGSSGTLRSLGGYPEIHILGDDFFSQAPILYGDYIAKVSVKPFSANLRALTHAPLDLKNKPNGIREAVVDHFRSQGGEWEFRVQLCTDIDAMPIEDPAKPWPEEQSPYVPVARICIPTQDAWSPVRIRAVEEAMSFSPWHALAAHRPLGAIMRVRKKAYQDAARFRAGQNSAPIIEPTSIVGL